MTFFYGNLIANKSLKNLNFAKFVNRNVKILGRKLYSLSLEDVTWLEDT